MSQVVGITSLLAVSADGVSFAIPIDAAKAVVDQLLARGRVTRPYIGIKMLQLTRANALLLAQRDPAGFPAGVAGGVLVPHVAPRSPAALAGLRPGDVIVGASRACSVLAKTPVLARPSMRALRLAKRSWCGASHGCHCRICKVFMSSQGGCLLNAVSTRMRWCACRLWRRER